METILIILFVIIAIVIAALGLDASASKYDIRTLKDRLDRRDALEAKKSEPSKIDDWAKAISVKELQSRLRDRDEEIKNLNGEIAKLKYDYANQVAGCKCHKQVDRIIPERDTFEPDALRGEWAAVTEEVSCSDPDCYVCHGELNATSPKPVKRKVGKPLSILDDLETDENKTE